MFRPGFFGDRFPWVQPLRPWDLLPNRHDHPSLPGGFRSPSGLEEPLSASSRWKPRGARSRGSAPWGSSPASWFLLGPRASHVESSLDMPERKASSSELSDVRFGKKQGPFRNVTSAIPERAVRVSGSILRPGPGRSMSKGRGAGRRAAGESTWRSTSPHPQTRVCSTHSYPEDRSGAVPRAPIRSEMPTSPRFLSCVDHARSLSATKVKGSSVASPPMNFPRGRLATL